MATQSVTWLRKRDTKICAAARSVAAQLARAMALRQTASSGRGTRRLTRRGLRELPPHLEEHLHSVRFHEWRPTGEHNVQGGAETVDVRGGTDQVKALRRMLWAHELRRARRRSRNGLVRRTAGRRGQRLSLGPFGLVLAVVGANRQLRGARIEPPRRFSGPFFLAR